MKPSPPPHTSRRAVLQRLCDHVLELPELPALIRCLTEELPRALGARDATLLLWDRRLESFHGLALTKNGRLRTFDPQVPDSATPRPRWLLSDGQLLQTSAEAESGILVPLLARTGLTGTLMIGVAARRTRPLSDSEARLVSLVAGRAALALENHAYQKELIVSERLAALGTVAGMLAHDFRGPITVIRGYAETLLDPGVPEGEVAIRARTIVEAADRLERMTEETLDFARGAERLVPRPIALGLLLAELVASVEQELPGLSAIRDFQVPNTMPILVDVDKLRRAVMNIASNARDAMGGRGKLAFSARVRPLEGPGGASDHLVLEFADEGPGVPVEIRDRLFEPFVSVGKKRGTGLGLAVARRFVEDHGGSLELVPASEPPAHGARFRLALPIVIPEAGGGVPPAWPTGTDRV
jgi:signal transduction histidine kinase